MSDAKLIVSALAAGAAVKLASAEPTAGGDAYAELKVVLGRRLAGRSAATALESDVVDAVTWQARLGPDLAAVASDEQVLAAARRVLAHCEPAAAVRRVDAGHARGVQVGDHNTQLNTTERHGPGRDDKSMHAGGDLHNSTVNHTYGGGTIIAIVAVFALAAVAVVVWLERRDVRPAQSACMFTADNAATVQPMPRTSDGLTFCPVQINRGMLPYRGPFDLVGQVTGPAGARKRLVLVNRLVRGTCDALGNGPAIGAFLMQDADLASPDGTWKSRDDLGYPEAVTLGRTYEFVSGTPEALQTIRVDRARWATDGNKPDDYPGLLEMPPGATVVAMFDVPAGKYDGELKPCPSP